MGLLRFGEWVSVMDPEFQFAGDDHLHYIAGALFQFLARRGVVSESRTRDKQRAFL